MTSKSYKITQSSPQNPINLHKVTPKSLKCYPQHPEKVCLAHVLTIIFEKNFRNIFFEIYFESFKFTLPFLFFSFSNFFLFFSFHKMGGQRLTAEEKIKRISDKQKNSRLFQNIKRLFSHKEVKDLLNYVPGMCSKYFIPNVSVLALWSWVTDIDPFKPSDN
jgi:hypothetical protein